MFSRVTLFGSVSSRSSSCSARSSLAERLVKGLLFGWLLAAAGFCAEPSPPDGNAFAHVNESDPFYPGLHFPKLITPQWIGEPEVEAVVVLAIDDMRDHQKYEEYLRPILERLKQIDGRAPVSIFANAVDPGQPRLRQWLEEGLSIEVHTLTHPCPLLARSNFVAAADTYHGCVDLLNQIPGNRPVAFRMPCCDSMNSPSPRFYAEIFNRANVSGQFLEIDSSVMNITTSADPALPREAVLDSEGTEKFRKYVPFPSFVTTIENYPYPYLIGNLCWEFPAMAPSDWEAQHLHGVNQARTVEDWKRALDVAVLKQGTFTFIFHPHGWIRSEQMIEFIDYAAQRHGPKVRFLNFREALARINQHLLGGQPVRASDGRDNGVRLADLNRDGYLDVMIANPEVQKTRIWKPGARAWKETGFPLPWIERGEQGQPRETGLRLGIVQTNGFASAWVRNESRAGAWNFEGDSWSEDPALLAGLVLQGQGIRTSRDGIDRGVRLRDLDGDGLTEWLVANESENAVFSWSASQRIWRKLDYAFPDGARLVDARGLDQGLRFVDLDQDGFDDLIYSNPERYGLYLFTPRSAMNLRWDAGWTQKIKHAERPDTSEIPWIVRPGEFRNNGAWFHSGHLWVQNEETAHMPDKVDRRSFEQLLAWDSPPPQTPEESRQAIRTRPELQVELAAHEPLLHDPVAFEWGADGKLWVVEMRDYPVGTDEPGRAGGAVRFLEDEDGDGRYDRSTVFLENLNFPTGVMPWRRGILVSAAPEIFYAEDRDGDGRADLRVPLLIGFGQGNQQHRVNGFAYGLDNWVYVANGDSGGEIRALGRVPSDPNDLDSARIEAGGPAVNIRGRDIRFEPDTGRFEAIAGQTQFGRHRDDWGNWFGNNNPNWLWHYHLPERYLARNPHVAAGQNKTLLANYPDSTRALAISRPLQRFNWPNLVNTVTSANSAMPYRDTLLGPDFSSSVFISEPAHNLIHREILEEEEVSFRSRRAADEQEREFLSSTDNWFRPTMIKTGPDGALYFADMYRLVIEHIEYGLPGMEKRIDLRAGHDMGRLYRLYPKKDSPRQLLRLDRLSNQERVGALETQNGWQRDTAQRLLVHAGDKSVAPDLEALLQRSPHPKVRLQALATLQGLGALRAGTVAAALGDPHPAVREHAVQFSEPFLAGASLGDSEGRSLLEALLVLVEDPSPRVRHQLAFSLGECRDVRAGKALARLALLHPENGAIRIAVLSSALPHLESLLEVLLSEPQSVPSAYLESLMMLASVTQQASALERALRALGRAASQEVWVYRAMAGLLDGLERRNENWAIFKEKAPSSLRRAADSLEILFQSARKIAVMEASEENLRLAALRLLWRQPGASEEDLAVLRQLLSPQQPAALQLAMLEQLKISGEKEAGQILLNEWPHLSPALRSGAVSVLLSQKAWAESLLGAIESGRISRSMLSPADQQRLRRMGSADLQRRAEELFATESDRQTVLQRYRSVLTLPGDASKGGELFRVHCGLCHQLRGEGTALGPDLGTLAGRSLDELLIAILDPNQAVESSYVSYSALTKAGRGFTGLIAAESANSLTLRTAGGVEEVVLRSDLAELRGSGLSLMPEGFEQNLTPSDLADLLAYILGAGP